MKLPKSSGKYDFRHDLAKLSPQQMAFTESLIAQPNALSLYGGAGYGGKSYGLRASAIWLCGKYKSLGFPGQFGYIASSTFRAMTLRHVEKLKEEYRDLGTVKTKNGQLVFSFRDESLGGFYLINLEDPDLYKSAEFAFGFIDELTENPEEKFSSMLYPIRSSQGLPFTPFGAATNPDGPGHQWVKKLWITRDYSGVNYDPDRFVFIPALPQDNPTWEMNINVQETLNSLPPNLRRARLEGSWDAPEGARWGSLTEEIHQFSFRERFPDGIPPSHPRLIGYDFGQRSPFAAVWITVDHKGDVYAYREAYQAGLTVAEQSRMISQSMGITEVVDEMIADPSIWNATQNPFGSPGPPIVDTLRETLPRDQVKHIRGGVNTPRHHVFSTLDKLIERGNGYPNLYISRDCTNLWRELTGAIWDKRGALSGKREDIDPTVPDHAIDALKYVCHTYLEGPRADTLDLPTPAITMANLRQEQLKRSERDFRRTQRNLNRYSRA